MFWPSLGPCNPLRGEITCHRMEKERAPAQTKKLPWVNFIYGVSYKLSLSPYPWVVVFLFLAMGPLVTKLEPGIQPRFSHHSPHGIRSCAFYRMPR